MSSQDPLSIGLGVDSSTEGSAKSTEAMAALADTLMNRMADSTSGGPERESAFSRANTDRRPSPLHEKQWDGAIPDGSIVSAMGQPFKDFEAANYKATSMVEETGERFLVRALAGDQFVVFPEYGPES